MGLIIITGIALIIMLENCVRYEKLQLLKMRTRFSLFELRDRLRAAARSGEVHYGDAFNYLDTTLSLTIEKIDQITVLRGMVTYWYYKKDARFQLGCQWVERAFGAKNNAQLTTFLNAFHETLGNYLLDRHLFSTACDRVISHAIESVKSKIKDDLIETYGCGPETSTAQEYCAQAA